MRSPTRRRVLLGMGLGAAGAYSVSNSVASTLSGGPSPSFSERTEQWGLRQLAHSRLGDRPVEFAEGSLRSDGRYALVGTWRGDATGSFLVDLETPAAPRAAHFLPGVDGVMSFDVKFDARDGLYYRTQQPIGDAISNPGIEIVDYGFGAGSPSSPTVTGKLDAGRTHNLFPHPDEPLVYATNWDSKSETNGVEIWDVVDPTAPRKVNEVGSQLSLHDMVLDPDRDWLHCAYYNGYVLMDASDPRAPTELGRFDYRGRRTYREAGLGNEAFQSGHYVTYDPRRKLAVMGDELGTGVPGGKHVFDIGWGEGSPANPIPIAFFVSPDAKLMEVEEGQSRREVMLDWTGHNFQVLPWGESTLLLSADWHEGVVLYDLTDPTAPTPLSQLPTDAKPHPDSRFGDPPFAWNARYDKRRGFGIASDVITGFYTFEIQGPGSTNTKPTETETTSRSETATPERTTDRTGTPDTSDRTDGTTHGTATSTPSGGTDSTPPGGTDGSPSGGPDGTATSTADDARDAGWFDFLDFDEDGNLDLDDLVAFVEDLLDF